MPFYTVFLVSRLQFDLGEVVTLTTLSSLGGLATLQGWGRLSERFGNRPVLQVCAMIWAITALVMWALARPGFIWHLYIGYFVVGAMTAGFQLLQFNLMVRLAPGVPRPAYVAVFLAFTSLLTAFGPVLGGQIIRLLPADAGQVLDRPVYGFHLLFAAAALGCLVVSTLVQRVKEPAAETPISGVWREMSTMRTFNPMLSILAVAELMLTPRGIFALGRRSLRSVRQQVKALEDVGEEFVEGGKEIITTALRRSDDDEPKRDT
jgi:MFS family permease